MFSMTTIASSTTSPVASVSPKSVSVLIENPSTFIKTNVPSSETGIVSDGISVVRQSCRKRKMTSTTSAIAINERRHDFLDRLADVERRVERDLVVHAGREFRRQPSSVAGLAARLVARSGRQLQDADADRVVAVVPDLSE